VSLSESRIEPWIEAHLFFFASVLRWCTSSGLPIYSIAFSGSFGFFAYLTLGNSSAAEVFNWVSRAPLLFQRVAGTDRPRSSSFSELYVLSSVTGIITWQWCVFSLLPPLQQTIADLLPSPFSILASYLVSFSSSFSFFYLGSRADGSLPFISSAILLRYEEAEPEPRRSSLER